MKTIKEVMTASRLSRFVPKEQAEWLFTNLETAQNKEAAKKDRDEAIRNLMLFLPTHLEWITWRLSYYGIPEFDIPAKEDLESTAMTSMLTSISRIDIARLKAAKDPSVAVATFKSFVTKNAECDVKNSIEQYNNIKHSYARYVLHMWKCHSGMTIQGHTADEITAAIRDTDLSRPVRTNHAAEVLIQWSNAKLGKQQAVVENDPSIAAFEQAETDGSLVKELFAKLSRREIIVFKCMYGDVLTKGQKTIEETARLTGLRKADVITAVRHIRRATLQCMSKEEISALPAAKKLDQQTGRRQTKYRGQQQTEGNTAASTAAHTAVIDMDALCME